MLYTQYYNIYLLKGRTQKQQKMCSYTLELRIQFGTYLCQEIEGNDIVPASQELMYSDGRLLMGTHNS